MVKQLFNQPRPRADTSADAGQDELVTLLCGTGLVIRMCSLLTDRNLPRCAGHQSCARPADYWCGSLA